MQDNDLLLRGAPILHWTMYNIPAEVTRLEPEMTAPPLGSTYGPNVRGVAQAYMGPKTAPGPKDHYHFEIFVLDRTMVDPGATYELMRSQMAGHVLASGEVVGLGERDPAAPPHP